MLLNDFINSNNIVKNIWRTLASESKFDIIEKLKRIERNESGYSTIIVPKNGFSENEETHELILEWLEEKHVNVVSVEKEIRDLNDALNCKN